MRGNKLSDLLTTLFLAVLIYGQSDGGWQINTTITVPVTITQVR